MARFIRWRIVLPYIGLILLTILALELFSYNLVRQSYLITLSTELTKDATIVGDAIKPDLVSAGASANLDEKARHWSDVLGARVTFVAPDGTIWGESHANRLTMDNHGDRPEVKQAYAKTYGSSTRFSQTLGYSMMYSAVAVLDRKLIVGVARVALPMQEVSAQVADLQRPLLLAGLVVAVISVTLAIAIGGLTTRSNH